MTKIKRTSLFFRFKNFLGEPGNRLILLFFSFIIIISFFVFKIEQKASNESFKNLGDWIWWVIVTIPTVGYGDVVPKTVAGRFLGIFFIIFGVAIYTLISGMIVSTIIDIKLRERRGLSRVYFKNHILILGWNANLEKILGYLPAFLKSTSLNIVLVNEISEEEFLNIKSKFYFYNLKFVYGDYTKETTLKRANAENANYAIILSDTYKKQSFEDKDEKTILSILTLRSLNSDIQIIAEVIKEEKVKPVLKAGANEVIFYGEFTPFLSSSFILSPVIPAFLKELLTDITTPKIELDEIPEKFKGKNFKDFFTHIRESKKAMPVAIIRTERELSINDLLSGESAIDLFIKSKLQDTLSEKDEEKKYEIKINPEDNYIIDELDTYAILLH
jgi:voltage-gated potassium channel